jgi:hypothetical protein
MNCKTRRDEAEGGLIDLVRRNGAQNFLLTIVSADGAWRVEFVDLDADMHKTSGGGFSFTAAWHAQLSASAKDA